MRLFLIENTLLDDLVNQPDKPMSGDLVAYFRPVQTIDRTILDALKRDGVRVEYAEARVTQAEAAKIDDFAENFATTWFKDGEHDPVLVDGISIGEFVSPELAQDFAMAHMVRFGTICQRIINECPNLREIVCDMIDGMSIFRCHPLGMPRRTILVDFSKARGVPLRELQVSNSVKQWGANYSFTRLGQVLKSYAGGFRPSYILPRLRSYFSGNTPGVYLFYHPGASRLIKFLSERPEIDVYTDRPGHNAIAIRFDHFAPLFSLQYLRAIHKLRQRAAALSRNQDKNPFVYDGIDYVRYFSRLLSLSMGTRLIMHVVKILQAKRMLRALRPKLVVINGVSASARAIIHLAPQTSTQVVFMGHGMNSLPLNLNTLSKLHHNLKWICHGDEHPYGTHIAEKDAERCPSIGSTLISHMAAVTGAKTRPATRKRVLIIGFGAGLTHTVKRVHNVDTYMIDFLTVVRNLVPKGYSFTYRQHAGPQNLDEYLPDLMKRMGVTGSIALNTSGTFVDAMKSHDLLITNLSSCIYQTIALGRPVIIHEPEYDSNTLMGILGSQDFEKPISSNAKDLEAAVLAHEDPESLVSNFPKMMQQEPYWSRFFGAHALDVDQKIADLIMTQVAPSEGPSVLNV